MAPSTTYIMTIPGMQEQGFSDMPFSIFIIVSQPQKQRWLLADAYSKTAQTRPELAAWKIQKAVNGGRIK